MKILVKKYINYIDTLYATYHIIISLNYISTANRRYKCCGFEFYILYWSDNELTSNLMPNTVDGREYVVLFLNELYEYE